MKIYYLGILLIDIILTLPKSKIQLETKENPQNIYCNDLVCPSQNGQCIENICLCNIGFTTSTNEKNLFCNYSFKKKNTAITFEFFFPFGMGHLYSGRIFHMMIKFILFWLISIKKHIFKKKLVGIPCIGLLENILVIIFLVLFWVDLIAFKFDYYKDGNGFALI